MQFDEVVIATYSPLHKTHMIQQLHLYGVADEKINLCYCEDISNPRNVFVRNFAAMVKNYGIKGNCAEAGVFQGDFAKVINQEFYFRYLYLFDTFEGFSDKDIAFEKANQYSDVEAGRWSETSMELVEAKMEHREMCKFIKGYFPESARGINDKFCFVNLDMDLYQPIYSGLVFFAPLMERGGVIMVHDFYNDIYRGSRAAVEQWMRENSRFTITPVGDEESVIITGF